MKRSPKLSPKIGASVLETLTTGMYLNPLDTVRELVQNAADSIRKSQAERVLSGNAGRIETTVGHNNRSLNIRDNGLGIPEKQVSSKLLNVGMSDKDVERDAGFRGIGRLAGIAFCNCFRFKTSAKGEAKATTCAYRDACPVHRRKDGDYEFRFTDKQRRLDSRRREEETDVFRERYRKRSGIEATNSILKRKTGLGRVRVRGRPSVFHSILLKVAGWNLLQAARALTMRQKRQITAALG